MTKLQNYGWGGADLDIQLGSTAGADTNDPTFLAHTGENWLHTPSHWENHLRSTLQYPAATPVVDIRWKGARTLGATSVPCGFWDGASTRSIHVRHVTNGQISVVWTPDGVFANRVETQSTVSAPDYGTFRVTVDATTVNYQVFFYTSTDDGATWSQLGAGVTGTSVAPGIYGGGDGLRVGNYAAGSVGHHRLDELKLLAGIDGTPFFEFDAKNDIVNGHAATVTSTSGHTLTVYRTTTDRKTVLVTRPTWLFGQDDYMEVANNALLNPDVGGPFTVVINARMWGSSTDQVMFAKTDTESSGYRIRTGQSNGLDVVSQISDGTNSIFANTVKASGQLLSLANTYGGGWWRIYKNGTQIVQTADTLTGAATNTLPLRVGRYSTSATNYADMELFGVAVFRRALTDEEINRIYQHFINS